jgi:HEAT repeat protein
VERARIEGARGGAEDDGGDGQADLAGFIAELRAEIEALRAFKASAVAAGFGGGAEEPGRKGPSQPESVAELGGRFDAEGRVGVSAGDRARMVDLLPTRADRALYERSMDDLSAAETGKRLRAVRALEALGSRAAAPLLAAALSKEPEAEVKGALLAALARFKEPFAADLADRELADPRPAVRVAALEALATVGDARAPERLSAALRDESPVVRRRAALLLGFTSGERAVESLAVALCDADRGVARAAAAALSGRPSARAQAALARGLEHPDLSVRRAAATALGRLSGEVVDADGSASARRASSRRIAERLATMDGEELRAAVLRSAETARVTAERVIAATATARGARPAEASEALAAPASTSTSTSTATTTSTRAILAAAATRARTAVAVVPPKPTPGDPELEPRLVAELRAALRGGTESGLASLLGAPAARVEAALAALAARGQVERRGTRWFVS